MVEVRGGQGAGHPRAVRHVLDPLLPGAQRSDREAGSHGGRPHADQAAAPAARRPTARPRRAPTGLRAPMSTPEPTGGPARPARIAGIVLLAVAAIALVMGVISLL